MTEEIKEIEEEEEQKYVQFLIEKNERQYRFVMPVGAPMTEAFDTAIEVANNLADIMKKATTKPKEEEEIEEEKPE